MSTVLENMPKGILKKLGIKLLNHFSTAEINNASCDKPVIKVKIDIRDHMTNDTVVIP